MLGVRYHTRFSFMRGNILLPCERFYLSLYLQSEPHDDTTTTTAVTRTQAVDDHDDEGVHDHDQGHDHDN